MLKDILYKQRKIQKRFTTNWITLFNSSVERWVEKYGVDKKTSILNHIEDIFPKIPFTDQLSSLWDNSYTLGEDINSKYSHGDVVNLSYFANEDRYKLGVRRKLEEKTTKEQQLSNTDFGGYMDKRNDYIFRNFTNPYKKQIRKTVKSYLRREPGKRTESQLLNGLKTKPWTQLTNKERVEAFDLRFDDKEWINSIYAKNPNKLPKELKDRYKNKTQLIEEINRNPEIYDSWGGYYNNIENRVSRIAQTEVSAAYNLGRISEYIERNVRYFMYDSRLENYKLTLSVVGVSRVCLLCQSLEGKIIDTLGDKNSLFMDFSKIDTKQSWDNTVTSRKNGRIDGSKNGNLTYIPVIHPNCYCTLIPLESEDDLKKYSSALAAANAASLISQVKNYIKQPGADKIASIAKGLMALGMVAGTLVAADQSIKALEKMARESYEKRKAEERAKRRRMLLIGSGILATGVMMYFFWKAKSNQGVKNIIGDGIETFKPVTKEVEKVVEKVGDVAINKLEEAVDPIIQEAKEADIKQQLKDIQVNMNKLASIPLQIQKLQPRFKIYSNTLSAYSGFITRYRNKLEKELIGTGITVSDIDNLKSGSSLLVGATRDKITRLKQRDISKYNSLRANLPKLQKDLFTLQKNNTISSLSKDINELVDTVNTLALSRTQLYNNALNAHERLVDIHNYQEANDVMKTVRRTNEGVKSKVGSFLSVVKSKGIKVSEVGRREDYKLVNKLEELLRIQQSINTGVPQLVSLINQ